ncbi:hypothetical protein GMA8713_02903 [Grimontia marina]|uniref:LamG-like jellyroll fold domain-containing protein n=2 Tax=Grimontia marina TaxID=646534 RepID=A0A128FB06_9GAMM|nr:hypothetical protein GMA8713_02903 [Grimontia marina]
MKYRIAIISLFSFSALSAPSNQQLPPLPKLNRDVVMLDSGNYRQPHITSNRSSGDGRVIVVTKSVEGKMEIYLRKPEVLTSHFSESSKGTALIGGANAFSVDMSGGAYFGGEFSHVAVCDTTDFYLRQKALNEADPRYDSKYINDYLTRLSPMPHNGKKDLYKLVVIGLKNNGTSDGNQRLVSIPVDVLVANPKTKNAYIESATPGTMKEGAIYKGDNLLEPTVTRDGRLLVARFGDSTDNVTWKDNNGSDHTTSNANIFYAYNNDQGPCDVSGWDQQRPIKYAPFDNEINQIYGFASQPFRYPDGSLVSPSGSDFTTGFGGTYPWIDRDGNNLFFTVKGRFLEQNDYELQDCDNCLDTQRSLKTLTVAMMGLWTRGKIVIPDNLLNNTDWGFEIADRPRVKLYRGNRGWVDAGVGRENGNNNTSASAWNRNSTIIESTEQLFNYHPQMVPLTPRDVVWYISNGKATDEIVFDDYLDSNALIVSDMNSHFGLEGNGYLRPESSSDVVKVQNAATGSSGSIPLYGSVVGSEYKRIEPQAMGGIKGKGLWLHRTNYLAYDFASAPDNSDGWLLSLFVDDRLAANPGKNYTLVTLASGGYISFNRDEAGRTYIKFRSNGATGNYKYDITDHYQLGGQGWKHFAIEIKKQGNTANSVTLFIDGTEITTFDLPQTMKSGFVLSKGTLKIGEGLRGWIDEVRLYNHLRLNNEFVCNLGHGSLVSTSSGTTCLTDHTQDGYAHLADKGAYDWVGDRIHQPVSVVWNQPRPSEENNGFCLVCHNSNGKFGLSKNALVMNSGVWASDDARRQPMDPPPRILGQIPQYWLKDAFPSQHLSESENGYIVDQVIHPD